MAGSQVFRQILCDELIELRKQQDYTQRELADALHRDFTTVSRFELGKTLIDGLQLDVICRLFEVDHATRRRLFELRTMAAEKPWWEHLGPRPESTSSLLVLEGKAHRVRYYDMFAIPGLLQTAAQAKAVNAVVDVEASDEPLDRDVQLRMQRQERFWQANRHVDATFLIDEAVLWRMPGNGEARRAQLSALLSPPANATILVLPLAPETLSPSMATYAIFDLDLGSANGSTSSTQAVHVEGPAAQQGVVAEGQQQVHRYELVFERTKGMALSRDGSREKIGDIIRSIEDEG